MEAKTKKRRARKKSHFAALYSELSELCWSYERYIVFTLSMIKDEIYTERKPPFYRKPKPCSISEMSVRIEVTFMNGERIWISGSPQNVKGLLLAELEKL